MNEHRLTEVEIKIAYQEELLQELNKIVAQQQQQLVLLEKTCKMLFEHINSVHSDKQDNIPEPPPPHY